MATRRRNASCISKVTRAQAHARARAPTHTRAHTHTHTHKYVILIASPRQQWFRERAPMLRYTYIVCLVYLVVKQH